MTEQPTIRVADHQEQCADGPTPSPAQFRWRYIDIGAEDWTEWSEWHSLAGACEACCCYGPETCNCSDPREHQEPGEPFGEYTSVHNRMCQGCWREQYAEPDGKVEYR